MRWNVREIINKIFENGVLEFIAIVLPTSLIILFVYYPIIKVCILLFFSGRGTITTFSGTDNIIRLLDDPVFHAALINTLSFSLVITPLMILLSMIIALALVNIPDKMSSLFSVIFFLPFIVSPVVYSLFFKFLFSNQGLINNILLSTGWIDDSINWFLNPYYAKMIILIACLWAWNGYYIMLFCSAYRRINPTMIEAAIVDGVSPLRIFTRIKLPTILPIIYFCFLIGFGSAIQIYAETMIITQGGPSNQTLSLIQYAYKMSFIYFPQFGYASLVSMVTILLGVLLLSIQYFIGGIYDTKK